MAFLIGCGGSEPDCPEKHPPSIELADAYRERVACITGVPYDGDAPNFSYANLDSRNNAGTFNECGIQISHHFIENDRDWAYPERESQVYLHEGCHMLGLDDGHNDLEWSLCICH